MEFRDGVSNVAIESYTYDKTGNRTQFTNSAGSKAYAYPAGGHRLDRVGATTRTYDAAGSTTQIGGMARQFVYDATGVRQLSSWRKLPLLMTCRPLMSTRKLFLAITLVFAVPGCVEVASTEYANRNQALARQAIGESKWMPAWLPEDAVNIRETHDIDTNESWLVFRPSGGTLALPEECKQAEKPEMTEERVMQRFPQFARDAWSRASGHAGEFYLCPEGDASRWAMYDEELNLVYSRVKF